MSQFLKFARDHLADANLIKTQRDPSLVSNLPDFYLEGIIKFQSILQEEDWDESGCWFNWGGNLLGVEAEVSQHQPDQD